MKIIKRGGTEDRGTQRGGGGSLTGKWESEFRFPPNSPVAKGVSACG